MEWNRGQTAREAFILLLVLPRTMWMSVLCEMNRSIGDPFSLFHYLLLLFSYSSPSPLPPKSSHPPQQERVCSGLPSAGNRRTLHTWAAHLTHTYESLKLKTHKHMRVSALDHLSRRKNKAQTHETYMVCLHWGHLADKNTYVVTYLLWVSVSAADPSSYLWTWTHPFLLPDPPYDLSWHCSKLFCFVFFILRMFTASSFCISLNICFDNILPGSEFT